MQRSKRPLKRGRPTSSTANVADWTSKLNGMGARAKEVIGTLIELRDHDLNYKSWDVVLSKLNVALARLRVLSDDITPMLRHSVICPGGVTDHTERVPNLLRSKLDVEIENTQEKNLQQLEKLFPEAFGDVPDYERLTEWVAAYDDITKAADADVLPTRERAGLGQLRLNPLSSDTQEQSKKKKIIARQMRNMIEKGAELRVIPAAAPEDLVGAEPKKEPPAPKEVVKSVTMTPLSLSQRLGPGILLHSGVREMSREQGFKVNYKVDPIVKVRQMMLSQKMGDKAPPAPTSNTKTHNLTLPAP